MCIRDSASKMRAAAISDDFSSFKQGVVDQSLANQLYDAVRKGMGLVDENYNESELVMDKEGLITHLQKAITKFAEEETDVDKLSYILKQLSGKTVKTRNQKYFTIADEDIQEGIRSAIKNLKGPGYYSLDKDNPDHPADISDKLRKRLKKKK